MAAKLKPFSLRVAEVEELAEGRGATFDRRGEGYETAGNKHRFYGRFGGRVLLLMFEQYDDLVATLRDDEKWRAFLVARETKFLNQTHGADVGGTVVDLRDFRDYAIGEYGEAQRLALCYQLEGQEHAYQEARAVKARDEATRYHRLLREREAEVAKMVEERYGKVGDGE